MLFLGDSSIQMPTGESIGTHTLGISQSHIGSEPLLILFGSPHVTHIIHYKGDKAIQKAYIVLCKSTVI